MDIWGSSSRVKAAGPEVDSLPLTSAEVRNVRIYVSTSLFMA
jgi:hypothetical protein